MRQSTPPARNDRTRNGRPAIDSGGAGGPRGRGWGRAGGGGGGGPDGPVPPVPGALDNALALVEYLRANCPWDREQTARSLVPHLVEETHETVDAIHSGDPSALLEELGDLLLNVAFQIVVAEEVESFTRDEVVSFLQAKMVRRHPHLFGARVRRGKRSRRASAPTAPRWMGSPRASTRSSGPIASRSAWRAWGSTGARLLGHSPK